MKALADSMSRAGGHAMYLASHKSLAASANSAISDRLRRPLNDQLFRQLFYPLDTQLSALIAKNLI